MSDLKEFLKSSHEYWIIDGYDNTTVGFYGKGLDNDLEQNFKIELTSSDYSELIGGETVPKKLDFDGIAYRGTGEQEHPAGETSDQKMERHLNTFSKYIVIHGNMSIDITYD